MGLVGEKADPVGAGTRIESDEGRREVLVRRLGRSDYQRALGIQEAELARTIEDPAYPGAILVVEHEPVFTLGRSADSADLQGAPQRLGVPVFRIGRGGGATFHGPGQCVLYPVVRLPGGGRNVSRFIRSLEAAMVAACARLGVAARALEGQTGVWVGAAKIGSIGIGVRRGVGFHGLALNVSNALDGFDGIVTCRAPGLEVTTLVRESGREIPLAEVEEILLDEVCRRLDLIPVELQER